MNETNKQKRMSQDTKSDLVEENKNLKARFDALLSLHSEAKTKVTKLET